MLAVVSAVVAFDAWPGGPASAPIHTLVLTDKPAAIRVTAHSIAPAATPAVRGAVAVAARGVGAPAGRTRTGGGQNAAARAPARAPLAALPVAGAKPLQSVQQ